MSKVLTPEFRVSFPNIITPRGYEDGDPKYSLAMLFKKGTDLTALKKLAQEAAEEKWPDVNKRPKNLRNPLRDGDEEKSEIDGYQGVTFANASSKKQPLVFDKNVTVVKDSDFIYAGCYARATITAYAYDTKGNKGVAFGLRAIQKVRDGEPFSGDAHPEEDFCPIEDATSDELFGAAPTVKAQESGDMFV